MIPAGSHVESRPRKGLIIAAAIPLAILYGYSLKVAAQSSSAEGHWLAAPVIGPWIAMGIHRDPCADRHSEPGLLCFDMVPGLELLDGLGQLVGATLLTVAIASPREVLVYDDVPATSKVNRAIRVSFFPRAFAPERRGFGLDAIGTF
jgi:hypothetical protein